MKSRLRYRIPIYGITPVELVYRENVNRCQLLEYPNTYEVKTAIRHIRIVQTDAALLPTGTALRKNLCV